MTFHGLQLFRAGTVVTIFGTIATIFLLLSGAVTFTTTGMEGETYLFMIVFSLIGIGFILMAVFYNQRDKEQPI